MALGRTCDFCGEKMVKGVIEGKLSFDGTVKGHTVHFHGSPVTAYIWDGGDRSNLKKDPDICLTCLAVALQRRG